MELHFTDTESRLVHQVLRNYLGDLRMEIADTDSYDFRQALKADERTLRNVIEQLEGHSPVEAVQTP